MGRIGQPTAHGLIEARCLARRRTPQAGDCEALEDLFKPSLHPLWHRFHRSHSEPHAAIQTVVSL